MKNGQTADQQARISKVVKWQMEIRQNGAAADMKSAQREKINKQKQDKSSASSGGGGGGGR